MRLFVFIAILFTIVSCDEMKELAAIKEATTLTLCVLSADQVSEATGKDYIQGRKITKKIELTSEQRNKLLREFLNKNNYEPLARKCPFEPVYALQGNDKVYALLDVEFCPTIQFDDKEGKAKYLGIKTENSLKTVIAEIRSKK